MKSTILVATLLALFVASASATAEQSEAVSALTNEVKAKIPPNWQLHASQRDGFILVSLIPPTQEAFELWYNTDKQTATLQALCPPFDQAVWNLVGPDQDIVLEPTVGGKSVPDVRVSCRKVFAERPR